MTKKQPLLLIDDYSRGGSVVGRSVGRIVVYEGGLRLEGPYQECVCQHCDASGKAETVCLPSLHVPLLCYVR